MESGIVYGLSAALKGAMTFANGRAVEGNFDTYDVVRMNEAPTIEVHIVPSSEPLSGVGGQRGIRRHRPTRTPPAYAGLDNPKENREGRCVLLSPIDFAAVARHALVRGFLGPAAGYVYHRLR
jgi:hypothetical protein